MHRVGTMGVEPNALFHHDRHRLISQWAGGGGDQRGDGPALGYPIGGYENADTIFAFPDRNDQ